MSKSNHIQEKQRSVNQKQDYTKLPQESSNNKENDGTTTLTNKTIPTTFMGTTSVQLLVGVLAIMAAILGPQLWNSREIDKAQHARELQEQRQTVHFPCNNKTLADYLHEISVPGLHVICLQDQILTLYPNAQYNDTEPTWLDAKDVVTWDQLRRLLVEHLTLRPTDEFRQPWAMYNPVGEKLFTEIDDGSKLITQGMFLVFQGGQWIWPGVRKGFRRIIALDETRNATLETLSLHPLVLSVQGFLSIEECEQIQRTASPTMHYSQVALMDRDKGRPATDFRTSQTTFLRSHKHPFLKAIDNRTSALVRLPINHQEHVQVLRYGYTEKYDSHHDYFDPELYKNNEGTQALTQKGHRNRMITVLWYLSDVEEGGETVFPLYDLAPRNFPKEKECELGLRVHPEVGKVIVFYSQTPDGALDPYSLHGACPVKKGVKWAANKWVWNAPMKYVMDS